MFTKESKGRRGGEEEEEEEKENEKINLLCFKFEEGVGASSVPSDWYGEVEQEKRCAPCDEKEESRRRRRKRRRKRKER